jgi:DNA-binding MarR family transcriptional regulator
MPRLLTHHQYRVLEILAQRSHWTLEDIAQILQVSKSAASKSVKRLVKQGVIHKSLNIHNNYSMHISITRDGEEAIDFISGQKFLSDRV